MVLADFSTMSELPSSESTNHCEASEYVKNLKLQRIKRQRTSSDPSLKSIDAISISQSFVLSTKMKEHFRNHFEKSVRRAVDGVLNRLLVYNQTVKEMKEETEKLRFRLEKMECAAEKVYTLIATSKISETTITRPPVVYSPVTTSTNHTLPVSFIKPTTTADLRAPLLNVVKQPAGMSPTTTNTVPSISVSPSMSQDSLPHSKTFRAIIDLTAETTPNSVDPIVSPKFNKSCGVLFSSNSRPHDSMSVVDAETSVFTSSVGQTTTSILPDKNFACSAYFMPAARNHVDKFSSPGLPLSTSPSVAPLPVWYPSLIATDKSGRLTTPHVQPPLSLVISPAEEGVSLRWELGPHNHPFEPATVYELFSYASSDIDPFVPLTSAVWQKVGDVEALPLPMICTLTSVISNNVYYFIVRSKDRLNRRSDWSNVVNAHVS